ncbi:MAG: response regulator [Desulfobacterales bacterium]|nr:response regulator [Desulfobacterales bacterium]
MGFGKEGRCSVVFDKRDARILVVDDDKEFADLLVEHLLSLGYWARAAYTGREGIDRFNKGAFQLVITDLKMPDVDGMDLLEVVKGWDKQAVVMVITGYGTIESAVDAIKKGAYDYINKPVKMEELEVIIDRALDRYALSKQLGLFRGLMWGLIISIPFWLIVGIVVAVLWK